MLYDFEDLSDEEREALQCLPMRGSYLSPIWTPYDLVSSFRNNIAEPAIIVEPDIDETPEKVLRRKCAALGIRILDLRGRKRRDPHGFRHHCIQMPDGSIESVPRKKVAAFMALPANDGAYDWGIWGWFGGGKNMPARGRAHGKVAVEKCHTTIIHTAAVHFAGPRAVGMPVQNGVDKNGDIILLHSIFAKCWASHAGNGFSDSFEISGKGANTIDEKRKIAAQLLLEYIIASKRRNLAELGIDRQLYVGTHCQTHWSRTHDCGAKIWDAVGEWALSSLDLKLGPIAGSGKQPDWLPGTPVLRKAA